MSWEEKNRLYMKAAVSFIVVFFIFMGYLVYLMQNNLFNSTFDLLVKWGLPFVVTGMLTMNAAIEILYYLRVKKSLRFHLRRFCINTLLIFTLILSFFGFTTFVYVTFSPHIGNRSLLLALVVWAVLLAAIAFRFQHILRKYWKEP